VDALCLQHSLDHWRCKTFFLEVFSVCRAGVCTPTVLSVVLCCDWNTRRPVTRSVDLQCTDCSVVILCFCEYIRILWLYHICKIFCCTVDRWHMSLSRGITCCYHVTWYSILMWYSKLIPASSTVVIGKFSYPVYLYLLLLLVKMSGL